MARATASEPCSEVWSRPASAAQAWLPAAEFTAGRHPALTAAHGVRQHRVRAGEAGAPMPRSLRTPSALLVCEGWVRLTGVKGPESPCGVSFVTCPS